MTTTKHQYQLGQRVRFRAYMQRGANKWLRCEFAGKGVIAGKRNCTDGYTSWDNDGGTYHPTKHHTFWLVAYSLAGFRYVAEGDLEDVDGLQNQVKELEARIEEIEAEHGQELRGMRAFSIDLEARLKEAREETRQEANRANNAALRAKKNALRLRRMEKEVQE